MSSRREFLFGLTALTAAGLPLTFGKIAAAGMARPEARDEPCLPPMHIAYDVVQQVAQQGFNIGYPDGTFAGKFPVSRQAFVWTLRALFSQVPYCAGSGAHLPMYFAPSVPAFIRKLSHELAPEFTSQGVRPSELALALTQFERIWNSRLPCGVTEPVPLPPQAHAIDPQWPVNGRARSEGAQTAQAEWRKGRYCLMQVEPVPDQVHTPNAIPLVSMPEAEADPYAAQVLFGHNAEVWRLLRRFGPPKQHRLDWTRDLFRLRRLWTQPDRTVIALKPGRTYHSPDGHYKFDGIRFVPTQRPPRVAFRCEMSNLDYFYSHGCMVHSFALMWGVPGTAVAYLRAHGPKGARNPARLFAIDLRTEIILNAAVA